MNSGDPPDDFVTPRRERLRRRVLRAAQRAFHVTRADELYLSASGKSGVIVLLYHSVAGPETARFIDPGNRMDPGLFEREMAFIAKKRRPLALEALLEVLAGRAKPEPGSIVVTFDDGYCDTLTVAAPLLESLKVPAVLYLPTRLIARGESPWADVVYSAFRYRTKDVVHLPALRQTPYALHRLDERRAAYRELTEKLIETDLVTRRSLVEQALDALAPSETPPRLLLNWTDVRELRRRHPWFRLGAHGAEHLDMTSQTDDTLDAELEGSRREFETELGEPALHFAYPYSRSNERTRRAFDRHPFATAMTSSDAGCLVEATTDSLAIPRLDAPEDLALLGHWTSGAYPRLSQKVFGRS